MNMRRLLAAVLFAFCAQTLVAADLELGVRHLAMQPMSDGEFDGGKVDVVSSRGFGATAELFWSERFSTQLAATFFNPATILYPENPPPHDVDLGTLGVDAYSLTARRHFVHGPRWSSFAGAGVAIVSLGNLEDRFGDDLEMELERATTYVAEAGLRYRIRSGVVLDVAVGWMPLDTAARFVRNETEPRVELPERVEVDALLLSVGAAWRF